MSTNSYIFYEDSQKNIKGVSCHYDGYLLGVGATLYKHYRNIPKIEQLISLGNISSLDKECSQPPKYQILGPHYSNNDVVKILGYTLAYHRDYQEPLSNTLTEQNLEALKKTNYVYLWRNNQWFIYNSELDGWVLLKDALDDILNKNKELSHINFNPQSFEIELSLDEFLSTIRKGFLIHLKQQFEFSKGDFLKLKAKDYSKNYELLVKIDEILIHEGINSNYQLAIMSPKPDNIAWFYPIFQSS